MSQATDAELQTLREHFPQLDDCCANDSWRGRLCHFHQGWIDGWDAAVERDDIASGNVWPD